MRQHDLVAVVLALVALVAAVTASEAEVKTIPEDGKTMASEYDAEMKCTVNLTDEAAAKQAMESEEVEFKWFSRVSSAYQDITTPKAKASHHGNTLISTLRVKSADIIFGPKTYKCRYMDKSDGFFSVDPFFKLEKLEKSTTVVEGEDLMLRCKLKAKTLKENSNNVSFNWFRKAEDAGDSKDFGTQVENGTMLEGEVEPHFRILQSEREPGTSILKIENTAYNDRAIYTCVAKNEAGQESDTHTLVRVKDKYAALYPLIGIILEVVVLFLIIFICEKRKSKEDTIAEDDEDESHNGTAGGAGNSNLRHRRT